MSEPMTKEDMMRWAEALREEMRAQFDTHTRVIEEQREIDAQRHAENKADYAARMEEARRRDDRKLFASVMATLVGGALGTEGYRLSHVHAGFEDWVYLARRIIDEGGGP